MTNPVRNHLSGPGYGCKTGDRMDATSRHLCNEIEALLLEYETGLLSATVLARELDNVRAMVTLTGTILPAERMTWETSDVDQWLPKDNTQ